MKILSTTTRGMRAGGRRGAALLLSLMILLILVAIVIQINVSTGTDARIGRNDVMLSTMDLAAESALLQCAESLKTDAEADATAGATAGAPGAGATPNPAAPTAAAGGAAPPEQPASPVDSRRDEWATPQRTEINDIQLRIVTQDENSKYNVLNLMGTDEKEADAAFDRVVRILDACREGTQYDIDVRTAEEMTKTMREHMLKRRQSKLPRPKLLTDDEKNDDVGIPLSMREFLPLEPFEELHFKDFRDQDHKVVHSITTFLTVWSSLQTNPMTAASSTAVAGKGGSNGKSTASNNSTKGSAGSSAGKSDSTTANSSASGSKSSGTAGGGGATTGTPGTAGTAQGGASDPNAANQAAAGGAGAGAVPAKAAATTGGFGVNVNTAPAAVLKSLFDSREVPGRFWDKVIEYRNLEDEEEKEKAAKESASSTVAEEEERLDEYGQPILLRQIFKSVQDLSKVDGWGDIAGEMQTKITQILTVQSEVFSVFVIARKVTSVEDGSGLGLTPAQIRKNEETSGNALQRIIHAVFWRQKAGDETKIVPVVRWEVLDYMPYEVLDFPPDDR